VMGGFLNTLVQSGRTMIGDVSIYWPNVGFPHYDELCERLEADNQVDAACPIIESFGVVALPDDQVHGVMVKGVDGERYTRVTEFERTVWWRPLDNPMRKDKDRDDPRLGQSNYWEGEDWNERLDSGLSLSEPNGSAAVVPGIELSGWNIRMPSGVYIPGAPAKATRSGNARHVNLFLPDGDVTLHLMPLDNSGRGVEMVTRTVPVANEFHSGIFEADARTLFARFDLVQSMLNMDRAERIERPESPFEFDPATGQLVEAAARVVGIDPARATTVLVRAAAGVPVESEADIDRFREVCEAIYSDFAADHDGQVPGPGNIIVRSWRDLNRTTIAAVEKETGLVLFVFGLVCFTTVFLVLAIFWSMVSEKTKDIGILRSLGGSTTGITWLWLRYGGAVGIVGSGAGLLAAWLVVRNINEIHEWLGANVGLVIWDPSVYYFFEIPSDMDWQKAAIVVIAGIGTCLFGAALPALRAGLMDPVRALRFE
ncbi:MAG: FtsX-like permease family protein, partial [Phycisphaerales bacterium]|nr:FtsX-like permease family protein [Phycisphaerales bacterium]